VIRGIGRVGQQPSHRRLLVPSSFSSSSSQLNPRSIARAFTSSTPNPQKEDDELKFPPQIDAHARGVGQVIFLNSPHCGAGILLGLAVGDPSLAMLAALGTVTANETATRSGLDKTAIANGLMGYNGCLVGCAASVFGPSSLLAATTFTVIGAAATPFCAVALSRSGRWPSTLSR